MSGLGRLVDRVTRMVSSLCARAASDGKLEQLERRIDRLEALVASMDTPATDDVPTRVLPDEGGWVISGGGRAVYQIHRDEEVRRVGHATLRLHALGETHGRYGTWMRSISATPYAGKRIRLSAHTKTDSTTRRADFWTRVQAIDSPGDGSGLGGGPYFSSSNIRLDSTGAGDRRSRRRR